MLIGLLASAAAAFLCSLFCSACFLDSLFCRHKYHLTSCIADCDCKLLMDMFESQFPEFLVHHGFCFLCQMSGSDEHAGHFLVLCIDERS